MTQTDSIEQTLEDVDACTTTNADELDGTVFICDNLPFLKSLDDESIDLVCIDPPFGKKQTFTGQVHPPLTEDERRIERELMESWGVYDADTAYVKGVEFPDQEGRTAKFEDIWSFQTRVYADWMNKLASICPSAHLLIKATRYTHSDSIAAYIAFMVERMLEVRRVLKPTGSVYLHCDHEANAYLRQMMDAVFGESNFRNEIVWKRRMDSHNLPAGHMGRIHDTILFYAKSESAKYRTQYQQYDDDYIRTHYKHEDERGRYRLLPCNNASGGNRTYRFRGVEGAWRHSHDTMQSMYEDDLLVQLRPGSVWYYKKYLDDALGVKLQDLWSDISGARGKEKTGYPTQKPWRLAERIIQSSSDPGDLVLDCFAGCAYVPVAAQLTGRRWVACDMSPRAWTMVRRQFHKHPRLGIVSEGEVPRSETEQDAEIKPQLATANRIIKVRGPDELPQRRTPDIPLQITNVRLSEPTYRQKPKETSDQIWDAFVHEWGTGCWYCGRTMGGHRQELHLDHIEPNRRDGSNDDCWNRALACTVCNSNKSDRLTPEQTIRRALEDGLIQTDSLHDEVLRGFKHRHDWAKLRWETEVKPNAVS